MGYRSFLLLAILFALVGCSQSVIQEESFLETQNPSPECVKLRTFLEQDFLNYSLAVGTAWREWEIEHRSFLEKPETGLEKVLAAHARWQGKVSDPVFWNEVSENITKTAPAVSSQCREIVPLRRVHRLLSLWRWPSPEASRVLQDEVKIQLELEARNRKHVFRLPGENAALDRPGYLDRLSLTADSIQRERLFKLFNASRALRWSTWGFRDLVLARNQSARLFGKNNFAELMVEREGFSFAEVNSLLEDIRNRIVPELQQRLAALVEPGLTQPVQAWDVVWLHRGLLPRLPSDLSENAVLESFLKGLDEPLPTGGAADLAPVVTSWGGVRRRVAQWATSKIPAAPFPDTRQSLGFAIQTLYDRLLHTMSFQTLLQRGPASLEMERASLVASIELLQKALALDFEITLYQEPERDYSELWAEKWQSYWGSRLESFYAGWDEDSFLSSPFQALNEVTGTALADFWLEALGEVFPELWGNTALSARLKDRLNLAKRGVTRFDLTRALTGQSLNLTRYP